MTTSTRRVRLIRTILVMLGVAFATSAQTAPLEEVRSLAAKEKTPLLATLKDLVSIESGSGDREGLDRLAALVADRLAALGGTVDTIEPEPAEIYRMVDTPKAIGKMVRARFSGTGSRKILLIAHMDTVYLRGMLEKQPFRIDGNRAYGLAIADDKQGIALILHTLAMLKAMNFRDYGLVSVLINADEEVSSPGSRTMLTRLGGEHDAVMSFESSRVDSDRLSLTTAGIAAVLLNVQGKASHAGSAPEFGRNALYELAHQVLQTRDLSDPATGVKMNWTYRQRRHQPQCDPGGRVRGRRRARAAGCRLRRHRAQGARAHQDSADPRHQGRDDVRAPPAAARDDAGLAGARRHAQRIYSEIGMSLVIGDVAEGGGTDAAFAALKTKAPVIERFGLRGFGAHSNDAEYIDVDSIEPRLYLAARMIMDLSLGKQE